MRGEMWKLNHVLSEGNWVGKHNRGLLYQGKIGAIYWPIVADWQDHSSLVLPLISSDRWFDRITQGCLSSYVALCFILTVIPVNGLLNLWLNKSFDDYESGYVHISSYQEVRAPEISSSDMSQNMETFPDRKSRLRFSVAHSGVTMTCNDSVQVDCSQSHPTSLVSHQ